MTLHPQAVAALELWSRTPSVAEPGFSSEDIEALRADQRSAAAAEPREQVDLVRDVTADGVACRLYVPSGARRVLVYVHGGGFVFGDLDTHDPQARRLANRTGSAVLAVDYRRPPEHRFPAAPDDVDTVLAWLLREAEGLGLDPARVAAVGDSAGGNLAMVAALRNPGMLAACVLVCPFVDAAMAGSSYDATDGGLTRAEAAWYWEQYARNVFDLADPDLSPYVSTELGTLPPTLVQVAEHDVLADEDLVLAGLLVQAGVPTEVSTFPGMVHGFWRHPALFDAAEDSLQDIRAFLDLHA
jgi:acetyl esterase